MPGAVFAMFEVPPYPALFLILLMIGGWLTAACGASGYLRWWFQQAKRDAARDAGRDTER